MGYPFHTRNNSFSFSLCCSERSCLPLKPLHLGYPLHAHSWLPLMCCLSSTTALFLHFGHWPSQWRRVMDHHLELNSYGPSCLKAIQNMGRKWGAWWWVDELQGWSNGGFALRCWTWKRLAWDMGLTVEIMGIEGWRFRGWWDEDMSGKCNDGHGMSLVNELQAVGLEDREVGMVEYEVGGGGT